MMDQRTKELVSDARALDKNADRLRARWDRLSCTLEKAMRRAEDALRLCEGRRVGHQIRDYRARCLHTLEKAMRRVEDARPVLVAAEERLRERQLQVARIVETGREADVPVVKATVDPRPEQGGGHIRGLFCPYCLRYHIHGAGSGHRIAHCRNGRSPYETTGYILSVVN